MKKGKLYLIPNVIAENTSQDVIAQQVREVVKTTDYYLVENIRTARRYISSLKTGRVLEDLEFEVLDKKTKFVQLSEMFEPIFEGSNIGIISESGCPGVADPGSMAVAFAHERKIEVVPLVGPSSLLMALMASGFNGQKFCFHGYLPIDKKEASIAIKSLETESNKNRQTQIFIETPFRNNQIFQSLISHCRPETQLCVAKDISGPNEYIKTKRIRDWKNEKPELHKVPVVFLLYSC